MADSSEIGAGKVARLIALAGVVAILGAACSLEEGSSGGDGESASLGEPASDGQFTFTVESFECGETKLGSGPLSEKAQGQFCVAEITVENTGNEAALLDASSQYAFIGDKKYEATSDISTKGGGKFFLSNINPGNTVSGTVAWDVPTGQEPDRLELHDSPFSGGITVEL